MSRFTLTPRAAIVLAAVVVVVALVVIVLGARGSGGGTVAVTGAASSASGGASAPVNGAGAGAGPGAGAATASAAPSATGGPPVVVHVVGAVGRAGLVTVPGGSRVADALDAAGGATADADLARVNLARAVVDGEQLYVPRVGETEVPAPLDGGGQTSSGAVGGSSSSDVVDLNTADQAALETLPGIGPALAQRILAWREEHGRFASPQDLLEVNGIGDARFAELEDRVRV